MTIGDLGQAVAIATAGALAWRYMGTVFALTLFHRMPDDPGVRFAVVMLCRYAALAIASIAALSAIRLGMAQIGVVLAALGVGLGFGLQEIVSNFVCGIILLLERPIRIGDIVTVAETTGRVDRINIRATTIINADNQCMIVPNREFITGKLVNWTHRDKILRVAIKLGVAYGTDPDRVAELLMSVRARDPDVVISPSPAAMMEGFGDSSLLFVLYAFVPEPAPDRPGAAPALRGDPAAVRGRGDRDPVPGAGGPSDGDAARTRALQRLAEGPPRRRIDRRPGAARSATYRQRGLNPPVLRARHGPEWQSRLFRDRLMLALGFVRFITCREMDRGAGRLHGRAPWRSDAIVVRSPTRAEREGTPPRASGSYRKGRRRRNAHGDRAAARLPPRRGRSGGRADARHLDQAQRPLPAAGAGLSGQLRLAPRLRGRRVARRQRPV